MILTGLCGFAVSGSFAFTGCSSEADGPCISDEQFFAEKVWAPVLTDCFGCHNAQGQAAKTQLIFRGSSEAGFLNTNMEALKKVALLERDGQSYVLLKPTKTIDHMGGQRFQVDSPQYQALSEMVDRFKAPSACQTDVNSFFADVVMAGPAETLRMSTLELGGRLPTPEEADAVEKGGMDAVDLVLDNLLEEEAFYTRLKEIYNDLMLTDRYLNGGEAAVDLLNSDAYYGRWYSDVAQDPQLIEKYGARNWDDLVNKFRTWTNRGIGREPLELIAHVVRNNRSFKEVLTADYMVVNPFSARAYGVQAEFKNDADPNEFAEARREGFSHAGVLSSVIFLNRYPTTPTNRNRARSRMVYQFFLGTDILKTAEQPLDQSKITDHNPTMHNAACTVCHAVIDPLAAGFQKFNERGEYNPELTWPSDMRPPGFGTDTVPQEEYENSLSWVAKRVADDPRFALSAVYVMFTGLTGQKPLIAPSNDDPDFDAKFKAYLAQYHAFNGIARDFMNSGYNLKTVVKGIIKSPYFRARNVARTPEAGSLEQLGGTRLLPPEQLHRKIWAVTGYPWRPRAFEDDGGRYDYLLRGDAYRLLYGGIDSENVLQRISDPNGIMANIADRMSNEMACISVPRDFSLPQEERLLFPLVKLSFEPKDPNGFLVEETVQAIKENIRYLHQRILGESLSIDDPEIERTYQLFLSTWEEGKAGMSIADGAEGHVSTWLPGACQVHDDYWTREGLPDDQKLTQDESYTIRSWMSVVTYLMSDFKFLYQ